MTHQNDIKDDPNYRTLLDAGFLGIAYEEMGDMVVPSVMGNDKSIARSARMSYGKGTSTVNDDENLIRYLLRHHHTTPFEMAEIKFHVKMPIFVARQWIRHRTASINEYSGRYSEMCDEFYMPLDSDIMPQSKTNKQGRGGKISQQNVDGAKWVLDAAYEHAQNAYQTLLGKDVDNFYDLYDSISDDEEPTLTQDFKDHEGITRELARCVLPVSNYTELYWKANLHNIFHFLKLRMDSHAQKEIRVYADAMYELLLPYFPQAIKAFDDYVRHAETFSRMEVKLLKNFFNKTKWESYFPTPEKEEEKRLEMGMSKREWTEFKDKMVTDKLYDVSKFNTWPFQK